MLRALYERIEGGEPISLADVDAEIRITLQALGGSKPDIRAGAIKTSSNKITRPRNAAQAAYLDLHSKRLSD